MQNIFHAKQDDIPNLLRIRDDYYRERFSFDSTGSTFQAVTNHFENLAELLFIFSGAIRLCFRFFWILFGQFLLYS